MECLSLYFSSVCRGHAYTNVEIDVRKLRALNNLLRVIRICTYIALRCSEQWKDG